MPCGTQQRFKAIAASATQRLLHSLILLAVALLLPSIAGAGIDTVRLRDRVTVPGPTITLREIADLQGPEAQLVADAVVASIDRDAKSLIVHATALHDVLATRGANMARLTLSGAARCTVIREPSAQSGRGQDHGLTPGLSGSERRPGWAVGLQETRTFDDSGPARETRAPIGREPKPIASSVANTPIDANAPARRDPVIGAIARLAGVETLDLRVKFSASDDAWLAQPVGSRRVEIEPMSVTGVGRVPLTIRRWEGATLVDSKRVYADVERRFLALVAARAVSRGQVLVQDDVEVREVYLGHSLGAARRSPDRLNTETKAADTGEPLTDPAQVIGRQAVASIRPGAMVFPSLVRNPLLIRRGDTVNVHCIVGGVLLRSQARAEQDGAIDQLIPVRAPGSDSASAMTVRVVGAREVVVVSSVSDPKGGRP